MDAFVRRYIHENLSYRFAVLQLELTTGPLSSELKVPPADLTALAKKNNGVPCHFRRWRVKVNAIQRMLVLRTVCYAKLPRNHELFAACSDLLRTRLVRQSYAMSYVVVTLLAFIGRADPRPSYTHWAGHLLSQTCASGQDL